MPRFRVLCRVDAFVDYVADVEAENEEEAAWAAKDDPSLQWERESETEFDARLYVTLDEGGVAIEHTKCGDL